MCSAQASPLKLFGMKVLDYVLECWIARTGVGVADLVYKCTYSTVQAQVREAEIGEARDKVSEYLGT